MTNGHRIVVSQDGGQHLAADQERCWSQPAFVGSRLGILDRYHPWPSSQSVMRSSSPVPHGPPTAMPALLRAMQVMGSRCR